MTDAGLAKVGHSNGKQQLTQPERPNVVPVPSFMTKALKRNPQAWKNFKALAPSHQRRYTFWITLAKREETREKRLNEAIDLLSENKKLGLK